MNYWEKIILSESKHSVLPSIMKSGIFQNEVYVQRSVIPKTKVGSEMHTSFLIDAKWPDQ